MTVNGTPFSAASSMLGYLYQARVALLWSLQKLKKGNQFLVSIETLDDVTFLDPLATPIDVLQTKHHMTKAADLSDASEDLWKTLRVWFENANAGTYLDDINLTLITTSAIASNSAASYLGIDKRNIQAAIINLKATAQTSTNTVNASGYQVFLATQKDFMEAILERVVIIDNSPLIGNLDEKLLEEVFWSTEKKFHKPFLERLEGWWFQRVINQLMNAGSHIRSNELEIKMNDLREQFKLDSLPIDDDLLSMDLGDEANTAYSEYKFVKQLQIIEAGKRRIAIAIREYYKAFEQRSRWLRSDLIMVEDLKKYEIILKQEWEITFAGMLDEIGEEATNEIKIKAAQKLLTWAENKVIPIRSNVTAPFVSRGSFQILADNLEIGWHADFLTRLSVSLETGNKQ